MSATESSKSLEFRVGLFALVGLAIVGGMVVEFGRLTYGLRKSYSLTLQLPDASGLLKNSKVLLSGADVGTVASAPRILDHARGVSVDLKIFEPTRIPRNALVVVGSSGLLGDRYVDVITKADDQGQFFEAGEVVAGSRQAGIDDLTAEGGKLVADLRGAVANLNETITRVNRDVLKEQTIKDLQASVANLHATTDNFRDASQKMGGVLDEARGAVGDVRGVMAGARDTVASTKVASDDLQGAIADARKLLAAARVDLEKATHGNGPLATLMSDKELSDNLAALVSNLRRSGILFYKDRPAPESPTPAAAPRPARP